MLLGLNELTIQGMQTHAHTHTLAQTKDNSLYISHLSLTGGCSYNCYIEVDSCPHASRLLGSQKSQDDLHLDHGFH